MNERPRRKSTTRVGAVFDDRYVVHGLVGEGAMARVYRAEDAHTKRVVAVKVLEPHYFERVGGVAQFLLEAKAAQRVRHKNVVEVHSVGRRRDGRPYIVMEFLEGEPLGALLRRAESLPRRGALAVAARIAAGLAAAHAAGVVHRDVKPDNIFLVGARGRPTTAKLVDFGLAKVEQHDASMFSEGMAVGTTTYMAPEQVLAEAVDGRADIYGLGVVLFRMLTGHVPFENDDETLLLANQVLSPAPPPSWFDDRVNDDVDAVLAAMLRKDPANRYQTMDAVCADLRRLAGLADGAVEPPRPRRLPDRFVPKQELGVQVAAVLEQKLTAPE